MEKFNPSSIVRCSLIILSTAFFFYSFFGIKEIYSMAHGIKISKEKAIEIARVEIEKIGYNAKNMDVEVSEYHEPWNRYVPKESLSKYDLERKKKLEGKYYWAVYYFPKKLTDGSLIFGGDVCVFVDAQTGEVITVSRWK